MPKLFSYCYINKQPLTASAMSLFKYFLCLIDIKSTYLHILTLSQNKEGKQILIVNRVVIQGGATAVAAAAAAIATSL